MAASEVIREVGEPVLVADDVSVTYRLHGGKKSHENSQGKRSYLDRLMSLGRATTGGGVTTVEAVKGASMVVERGERVGIVGDNGAGKSTLLRGLAGLVPLSGGSVYTAGTTSLLGVSAALSSGLTGEQNIVLGGLALGLTRAEATSRIDEIAEFTELGEFIEMPMRAYSSGMKARLQFAVSMVAVPDILMIDEALATGDAKFRKKSMERMTEVRERAGTVFLVSHNANTIREFCDRVVWMSHGVVVADGPTEEVMPAYVDSK